MRNNPTLLWTLLLSPLSSGFEARKIVDWSFLISTKGSLHGKGEIVSFRILINYSECWSRFFVAFSQVIKRDSNHRMIYINIRRCLTLKFCAPGISNPIFISLKQPLRNPLFLCHFSTLFAFPLNETAVDLLCMRFLGCFSLVVVFQHLYSTKTRYDRQNFCHFRFGQDLRMWEKHH